MQSPSLPGPAVPQLSWHHYPVSMRYVAVGAAAGAAARWGLLVAAGAGGTTGVELGLTVVAALTAGVLVGRRRTRTGERRLTVNQYLLLGAGWCGALAPFSAFALHMAEALDRGDVAELAAVGLGTPAAAAVAAGIGYRVGSRS
ncbi:MAG: CrcB family protein [Acidimicrobiia bacterium]|nr:CrcB family protein [Acidimicrobiia bacterium]